MARNRSFAHQRKTPNRSWSGSVVSATIATSAKVLLGSFTLTNPGIDVTVLRTIIQMSIRSDQQAASEDQFGALGMVVVTDAALAAGAASISGPITDIGDDGWFIHMMNFDRFSFISAVGTEGVVSKYSGDFKSKRIVHEGQSIAIMYESAPTGDGLVVVAGIRMLAMVRGTG